MKIFANKYFYLGILFEERKIICIDFKFIFINNPNFYPFFFFFPRILIWFLNPTGICK